MYEQRGTTSNVSRGILFTRKVVVRIGVRIININVRFDTARNIIDTISTFGHAAAGDAFIYFLKRHSFYVVIVRVGVFANMAACARNFNRHRHRVKTDTRHK